MKQLLLLLLLMTCENTFSATPLVNESVFKDITKLAKVRNTRMERPSPAGKLRKSGKPVAFYIGDSTMRTLTSGSGWNGQWGFGLFAQEWFDEAELVVENHALGGTTSVTYYDNEWSKVKQGIQEGDYVVISFGHNDKSVDDFATYLGKYIERERFYMGTAVVERSRPFFELGYSFTNRYISVGMFAGFNGTKFKEVGFDFELELFRRW